MSYTLREVHAFGSCSGGNPACTSSQSHPYPVLVALLASSVPSRNVLLRRISWLPLRLYVAMLTPYLRSATAASLLSRRRWPSCYQWRQRYARLRPSLERLLVLSWVLRRRYWDGVRRKSPVWLVTFPYYLPTPSSQSKDSFLPDNEADHQQSHFQSQKANSQKFRMDWLDREDDPWYWHQLSPSPDAKDSHSSSCSLLWFLLWWIILALKQSSH